MAHYIVKIRDIYLYILCTSWKVSKHGVISGPDFPVFSLNTGKYVPKITQYLDTFHAVMVIDLWNWDRCSGMCLTLISEKHVPPASNLFLIMYTKAFFLHLPAPAPSTCLLILKWSEMNLIKTQASQYWGPYLIKYNVKRNYLLSYNSLTHFWPMPYFLRKWNIGRK